MFNVKKKELLMRVYEQALEIEALQEQAHQLTQERNNAEAKTYTLEGKIINLEKEILQLNQTILIQHQKQNQKPPK